MATRRLTQSAPHHLGIVVALAAEARALGLPRAQTDVLGSLPPQTWVIVSGMGGMAATAAATTLADAGVHALAVFGIAGALDPKLRRGTLLCPHEVIDDAGTRWPTDSAWRARLASRLTQAGLRAEDGALLGSAAPLLTLEQKQSAANHGQAIAVDMESAAVATVAAQRRLPLLVLRAIADEATDAIPAALAGAVDPYGRARPRALLAALLHRPALVRRVPRLASTMKIATASLHRAAVAAGDDLAWRVVP